MDLVCRFLIVKVIFSDCRAKELEVLKYYFCEYIVLFLTWFKLLLIEANLFVAIKLQPNLIDQAILYVACSVVRFVAS